MRNRIILSSLAMAGTILLAGTVGAAADSAMPQGACATIASAKFQQWRQMRMLMQRSKTFADGRTTNDELILTENTAYKNGHGGWTSAGITLRERAVPSPKQILHDMRLAECTQGAHETVDGTSATVFDYSYLPDDGGYVAHGRMWISDVTGLPVREELDEPAPPANDKVAKTIMATYLYNADVQIPRGAEVANSQRLWNNAAAVRNMQGSLNGGGPAQ